MKKFEVGKIYKTRLLSDHNLICKMEVIKRTEKTIVYKEKNGEEKRAKIYYESGNKYECITTGRYWGAPVYRANEFDEDYENMSYEELINFVCEKDTYNECIDEKELLDIINDRLAYGFYGQAKEFIDILSRQRYNFGDGRNYWKNDCGTIIPLLTEQDVLNHFDYLFE